MLDPFPPPPEWLRAYTAPLAEYLSLPLLSLHVHEVVLFFLLYQFVQSVLSPLLSKALFPKIYPHFNRRNKLNWDVHVVSLVQSTLINAVALWVMFADDERRSMTWGERVLGYSGACGLVQAMATGYFIWDLIVCTVNIKDFGVGLFLHAVSALAVYSFGFRPFVVPYSPVFILYELSTPFLNFHWFFDKVNMTGSRAQWYNGMLLLGVFFSCRLIWGIWQSVLVFKDIFRVFAWIREIPSTMTTYEIQSALFGDRDVNLCLDETCINANAQISAFISYVSKDSVPLWLVAIYLSSNLTLNSLNVYWFTKMIDAVMKRFRDVPSKAAKETASSVSKTSEKEANGIVLDAAAALKEEEQRKGLLLNEGLKESLDDNKAQNVSRMPNGQSYGARRRKA
ncbi:hypothetical protein VTO42DRAFT_2083 [Malbranchea cinnamomea]